MASQKQGARNQGAAGSRGARNQGAAGSQGARNAKSNGTRGQTAGTGRAAASGAARGNSSGGRPTGSSRAAGSRSDGAAKTSNAARNGAGRGATATAVAPGPAASSPRLFGAFRAVTKLQLTTLILSVIGLGVSIYLTVAHYDTSVQLFCASKGIVNCEEVTTSPESMVFGIFPVAVLGLAFFVFMTAINSPWAWRWQLPAIRWIRLASVIGGIGFVLYLVYAELIQIGAICLWCTSVHVLTFLLFSLIVFDASFSWGKVAPSQKS